MGSISFLQATSEDLRAVVDLLQASALPYEDIHRHLPGMVVAKQDDCMVGTVALEDYAPVGLLRSLAVAPWYRHRGLGSELLSRIVDRAHEKGVVKLYLLTTTAQDFFARQRFVVINRDEAPAAIVATEEFRTLCPSTAVCMRRHLSTDSL
jgi:amino-acid N-acetyltransferase